MTYETHVPSRLRFRIGLIEKTGLVSYKIMHGWTSEAMKALMIETGYGFIKCDPIVNEDAKLEKEWELRQGFSLEVYATRVMKEVVDKLTSVTISGEFVFDDLSKRVLTYNINKD